MGDIYRPRWNFIDLLVNAGHATSGPTVGAGQPPVTVHTYILREIACPVCAPSRHSPRWQLSCVWASARQRPRPSATGRRWTSTTSRVRPAGTGHPSDRPPALPAPERAGEHSGRGRLSRGRQRMGLSAPATSVPVPHPVRTRTRLRSASVTDHHEGVQRRVVVVVVGDAAGAGLLQGCLLYTSPSPRDS